MTVVFIMALCMKESKKWLSMKFYLKLDSVILRLGLPNGVKILRLRLMSIVLLFLGLH